jgi:hypothetical protein
MKEDMLQRLAVTVLVLVSTLAAANEEVRKLSAEPQRSEPIGQNAGRLDFRFGDIRGWLLANGYWHLEGTVTHRGARCAQYRLGVQFGIGEPGCANVKWVTEESYGSYEVQCNNAEVRHVGGNQSALASENFGRINCVQRLLQCSGNCQ